MPELDQESIYINALRHNRRLQPAAQKIKLSSAFLEGILEPIML